MTPREVLHGLVSEACVSETLGATEARVAATSLRDGDERDAFARIAADELRHAALGWRSLAWLLDTHPELAEHARDDFEHSTREALSRVHSMVPWGANPYLGKATHVRVFEETLVEVIRPTFELVLARARGRNTAAAVS